MSTRGNSDAHPVRRVGIIGLGVMGGGIAECLLEKGHAVDVHVRSQDAAERWRAAGARLVGTPRELAAACADVVLSLPDDEAVDSVLSGSDGLAAGLQPGACVIDTSTISAATTRRWAQALAIGGAHYLDAPVSGGQQAARDGKLAAMAGGSRAAFDAARRLAADFCATFVHVGPSGAGQIVKACNQVAVAGAFLGVAEAFALAASNDVDLATVREVLLGGSARSVALEKHGQRVIDQAFTPGFRAQLMHKDLSIASRAAKESGVRLHAAVEVLRLVEQLGGSGQGGLDWSAIATLVADRKLPGSKSNEGDAA